MVAFLHGLAHCQLAIRARTISSPKCLGQHVAYTDRTVTPTAITGGIGGYEAGNQSLNNQFQVKSTNIFKSHSAAYGIDYYDATYSLVNQRTGPTFTAPDGRQTATGASIDVIPAPMVAGGRIYRVTRANFNSERETPSDLLRLLRPRPVAGWSSHDQPRPSLRAETMSGTIIKDWSLKNNWAPRIGATFDVTGDGRTKIYGNYGRYYARIPNDLAARASRPTTASRVVTTSMPV